MSTHLQVLPKLRSTTSKLQQAAAGKENADGNIIVSKRGRKEKLGGVGESGENCCLKSSDGSNKSCHTPKSDANKIPKTLTCPPAPKKPARRAVLSCKRKLMPEFEFFEADRRQEVDEFFRSSFERISAGPAKRKVVASASSAAAADSSSSSSSSSSPLPPRNCV
uniref:Uncharacterized protein n=1 Tax=Kalanchoe fedtschenkoi TaxID=63787 RepID=A0A7N1A1K9_KALFE